MVSACLIAQPVTEPFSEKKKVAVVGGGNTALEDAEFYRDYVRLYILFIGEMSSEATNPRLKS